MQISEHIKTEAVSLLETGQKLPAQIASAPMFYVAEVNDSSILAFSSLKHGEKEYKIGTFK